MDGDAGPTLARGNTAEIRALGDGWVCKRYDDPEAVESVRYEARAIRVANEAGLPVPAVGGVVTLDGNPGVVLERVDGGTLLADLEARPWTLVTSARRFAALHARVHGCRVPDLPPLRDRLRSRIERGPTGGRRRPHGTPTPVRRRRPARPGAREGPHATLPAGVPPGATDVTVARPSVGATGRSCPADQGGPPNQAPAVRRTGRRAGSVVRDVMG